MPPFLADEHIDIPNKDLLSWMFDEQKYDVDKPIYVDAADSQRTISSRQAKSIVRKLCAGFKNAGLQEGDCVCMLSFNDIYYPMAFLGIISFGGVFSGVNPSHTYFEILHAFQTADVKALIVEPHVLPIALEAASQASVPRKHVFIFDYDTPLTQPWHPSEVQGKGSGGEEMWDGLASWRALLCHGECGWIAWDDEQRSKDTTAARLFSSGTTGLPKAVEMTHYNFVAQHTLVMEYKPRDYEVVRLLCTPMFHVSNVPRAHTSPLRSGMRIYVMRRFELTDWLRNIQAFRITETNMVPAMVLQILNSPLTTPAALTSFRNTWVGAAPFTTELQARFKAFLAPSTTFTQVWGMTETSCIATMLHYPEQDDTGSVGRLLPCIDAKLVDDDNNDITEYDVVGELCIRGPIMVKGYYNNPTANQCAWDAEGFFHTGDVAMRKRENGLWYIVDRKKELIKVRGFQVAPAELESVLLAHPAIGDAAVIGVAGTGAQLGNELPRAFIVIKKGCVLDEVGVQLHVKERLAGYKQLVGGVRFMDAIPRNASGKTLKGVLKDLAKQDANTQL